MGPTRCRRSCASSASGATVWARRCCLRGRLRCRLGRRRLFNVRSPADETEQGETRSSAVARSARIDRYVAGLEVPPLALVRAQRAQATVDVGVAAGELPAVLADAPAVGRRVGLRGVSGERQVEPPPRARERHVEQPLVLALALAFDEVAERVGPGTARRRDARAGIGVVTYPLVRRGAVAAVQKDHLRLQPLGLVHGHDLDGVVFALQALNVSLFRLGHQQLLAQRRESADDVAERPGGARGLGGEDLEQVADVDQPTRALAEEELAREDAALVEDARVEATERLARRGRVPGEETGEERVIALGAGGGREIGQREPEERRQPGAQPLGRDRAGRRRRAGDPGPGAPRARRRDPPGCR